MTAAKFKPLIFSVSGLAFLYSMQRSRCDVTMCSLLFRCRVQSTSASASTAGCWLPVARTTITYRQRSSCLLPRACHSRKCSRKLSNFSRRQYSMTFACGQTNWHVDNSPSELESEGSCFEPRQACPFYRPRFSWSSCLSRIMPNTTFGSRLLSENYRK
jgi:hypothetical protein